MRKGVLISSFVSFLLLSIGLIIRILTSPANLVWPALPWLLSSLFLTAGFIVMAAALIFYFIYWFQQERAKEAQFEQWGIVVRTTEDLLRCKVEKVRPYQREVWLQLALFVSLGLVLISNPVVGIILHQPGSYTVENSQFQDSIETTLDLLFWPGAPLAILICTFLSKDLAKTQELP